MERLARALANGMTSFELLNNDKLDKDLIFDHHNQYALADKVDLEDSADFPVVWPPKGVSLTRDGKLMAGWAEGLNATQKAQCEMNPEKYSRLMMVAAYKHIFKLDITE